MSTSSYPLFKHMRDAHGLTLLETELDEIIRLANQVGTVSEPTTPGFYWWRTAPQDDWRMVRVEAFRESFLDPITLVAYDVERGAWARMHIAVWKQHQPLGEWLAVERPGA